MDVAVAVDLVLAVDVDADVVVAFAVGADVDVVVVLAVSLNDVAAISELLAEQLIFGLKSFSRLNDGRPISELGIRASI